MSKSDNIQRLLAPSSIAFIGSRTMAQAAQRCRETGFTGDIWLVNPNHDTIDSFPCYPSVEQLPAAPDAAFIGVNKDLTISIVRALSEIGAGGAVCYASGFSETGEQGKAQQAELVAAAGDMALIGPNCYGIINYLHGAALWPVAYGGHKVKQGVAIITQSGNISYNISMTTRGVPIAYLMSIGNQADVNIPDLIQALIQNPHVTAIGLHLEGLNDVPAFSKAALLALQEGIPIVALKAGTSTIGSELAMSHTSSLAGSDELYDALFDRLGVIRVSGPVGLLETLKMVSSRRLPAGPRAGAIVCSGGDAGFVADYAEINRVELAPLPEATSQELVDVLPDYANITNPLDITTSIWGDEEALFSCAKSLFSTGYDFGVLVLDYPMESSGEGHMCDLMAEQFQQAVEAAGIPGIIISVFPELMPEDKIEWLKTLHIPALRGIESGLEVIGKVITYTRRRSEILDTQNLLERSVLPGLPITQNIKVLNEWNSKHLLGCYGLTTPTGCLASPDEAGEKALDIGFPLVVKVIDDNILHKTEAGAVKVNLKTPAAVEDAVAAMTQSVGKLYPDTQIRSILLEKMSPPPITELIVGVRREPGLGLALVIGTGGVLVELLNDSISLLLPVTETEVSHALSTLKISKLLHGYRGASGADMASVINAIMAIAQFATDNHTAIVELDVNPLMVLTDRVYAVDALIRYEGELSVTPQQKSE